MALRQIRPYFDPILKTVSQPVELMSDGRVPAHVIRLGIDMLETSRKVSGAGMAAVQVGEPLRMFVMDLSRHGGDAITFINPEIVETAEEKVTQKEGCLSMPGCFIDVERPKWARINYIGTDGSEKEYRAEGLAALCCQHEMDHLDGIRNIDRVSKLKRDMVLKKYRKQTTR